MFADHHPTSRESALVLDGRDPSLERLAAFVHAFCVRNGLAADVAGRLMVVLEELVVNAASHGRGEGAAPTITISVARAGDMITAAFEDDGRPFDPLGLPLPDLDAPLEQRQTGGLGILLVKRLMDEVRYHRAGDRNRVLLSKRLSVA